MRRREFITLLGGAATAWPLATRAQQTEHMRRIGVLMSLDEDDPEGRTRANLVRNSLRELGWTEGHNIRIDYRWARGDEARARAYAAELIRLTPDAIIANSTLCLKAVRDETSNIPIVFVIVGDPVGQGFVSSLAHPGGNITGLTGFEFEIGGKWLELLKEVAPEVRRVVFMFNAEAGLPYAAKIAQSISAAASARGVELIIRNPRDDTEIDHAIVGAASQMDSGVIVNADAFTIAKRRVIISLISRYRLPAIYPFRYFAVNGGLMSYGIDAADPFRRAASYVDRILKGAKPADLPVQNPTKFELIINKKTAQALGLTIPEKLLASADEVIE